MIGWLILAILLATAWVFRGRGLAYLMLGRVPACFLTALVVGPFVLTTRGSEMFWNLFVLERPRDLGVGIALFFPATWVCASALRIILVHGPARFRHALPCPRRGRLARWPWRVLWGVLPLLPAGVLVHQANLDGFGAWVHALGLAALLVAGFAGLAWISRRALDRFLEAESTHGLRSILFAATFGRFGRGVRAGYVDAEGHVLHAHVAMTAVVGSFFVVYVAGYWIWRPDADGAGLPALGFVLLLLTWLAAMLSGLSFFLDRFRVPTLGALLLVVWLIQSWRDSDHYYLVHDADPAPAPATAREVLESRSRTDRKPPLVVVCAEGGGIQAASWTAEALTGLQARYGAPFSDSLRLVSGVSGGSVGLVHFLRALDADGAELDGEAVRRAANASVLASVAWGLVYPDFLRVAAPWFPLDSTDDRASVVEQVWRDFASDLTRGHAPARPVRLSDWARASAEGRLPAIVFNATVVETGEQLAFKTYTLGGLEAAGAARPGELPRDFFQTYPGRDVDVVTAARLSATFPYVTPAARARGEAEEDRYLEPPLHVVDGGYFDNLGVASANLWLLSCFTRWDDKTPDGKLSWRIDGDALRRYGRIFVVLLRSFPFPEAVVELEDPRGDGWASATLGPIKTILATRTSSQVSRNRRELEALELLFTESGFGRKIEVVELHPGQRLEDDVPFSLSWHLTRDQIRRNRDEWDRLTRSGALDALDGEFKR